MKITIEQTDNGAILRVPDLSEVYEYEDDNLDGLRNMLSSIVDYLGYPGSKWDEQRIKVTVVHGRGYQCDNSKKCPICQDTGERL